MDRIRDPWLRALSILLVLIAGLYLAGMVWTLLVQIADILVLIFCGWLVAFMLEPAVAILQEQRGIRRQHAVGIVYVTVLAVLVGIGFWLVPGVFAQLVLIAQQWPTYIENVNRSAALIQAELVKRGLEPPPELWGDYQELGRRVASGGPTVVTSLLLLARDAANVVVDVIIVLMLSVYLTLDSGRITHAAIRAVPRQMRDDLVYFMESVRRAFGGFLRGQLVLGCVYGLATAAIMTIAGLDFVLVASVFAALVTLIPFLGPLLAVAPPALIALLVYPDRVWWIIAALAATQMLLQNVVSPRLMSRTVGMHPVLVIVAVLAGAKLAGVWGALFGVPIAGVAVAMISFYRLTLEERRARAAVLPGAAGPGGPHPAEESATAAMPAQTSRG